MKDADSLLQFPCRFPIKAMGRLESEFKHTVVDIVSRHADALAEENITEQPSSAGNFVSVTVTIEATSRDQLDRIYQDLTNCNKVLMAL
jgi:putative lipoic acid-binding regulatory protein